MNRREEDILELNEIEFLESGGMLDEALDLRDLKNRKLYLTFDITSYVVEKIIRHILQYNFEDKGIPVEERKPIILYITSNGGAVEAGFGLIDVITNSKTPIYTVNLAYQYSMGFLIGLAGHKRFAFKHAHFLMHDGVNAVIDSGQKAQDKMEFNKYFEEKIKEYVVSRTNVTAKEYNKRLRLEWYMLADEAKKWGMIDYIIGEDCSLDDVV